MSDKADTIKIKPAGVNIPSKLKKSEYDQLVISLKRAYDVIWGDEYEDE